MSQNIWLHRKLTKGSGFHVYMSPYKVTTKHNKSFHKEPQNLAVFGPVNSTLAVYKKYYANKRIGRKR
jgi:hypothetical protein